MAVVLSVPKQLRGADDAGGVRSYHAGSNQGGVGCSFIHKHIHLAYKRLQLQYVLKHNVCVSECGDAAQRGSRRSWDIRAVASESEQVVHK